MTLILTAFFLMALVAAVKQFGLRQTPAMQPIKAVRQPLTGVRR